jgi:hypothetical protein
MFYGCANREATKPVATSINTNYARPTPPSIVATPSPSPSPREEVTLQNGLRITPRNVKMENKDWRYQIDVAYPQIEGTNDRAIVILNRQIKALVTKTYSWPLNRPTKKDLTYYAKWPDVYNSVDMEYDVVLANDELLSIYFIGYHYGIGAAHSVHESFTVNYDLKSHRTLTLGNLFQPGAKYLDVISRRCIDTLSKDDRYVKEQPQVDYLLPKSKNFGSWNVTERGLRFNFDACAVKSCAEGDLTVEIPFNEFRGLLKSDGPLRIGGV